MNNDTLSHDDAAAYSADARADAANEGENILSRITRLTREALEGQGDVTRIEEQLKAAQERVRSLIEFQIPEAMAEAGQDKLRTIDGDSVEVSEKLHASIPQAHLGEAVMWLCANGQSAIVKRELKLAFGKEEDQQAARAYDVLRAEGYQPTDKQSVHPQTLAAAIREMLAEGVNVPLEILGAHVRRVATIKPSRK